jgi:hypothetical protein
MRLDGAVDKQNMGRPERSLSHNPCRWPLSRLGPCEPVRYAVGTTPGSPWFDRPAGTITSEGNVFGLCRVQRTAVPGTWASLSAVLDWSPEPPTQLATPSEGRGPASGRRHKKKVLRNQLERWQRPSIRVSRADRALRSSKRPPHASAGHVEVTVEVQCMLTCHRSTERH